MGQKRLKATVGILVMPSAGDDDDSVSQQQSTCTALIMEHGLEAGAIAVEENCTLETTFKL